MLNRIAGRFLFSKQVKYVGERGDVDTNLSDLLDQRRRLRQQISQREKANLPIQKSLPRFYQSIVKITLFMRQDCWKSQYIYSMLNYNRLGFRRISDLVFLDRASYFLKLRKVKDEERWPSIKVVIGLQPKIILSGVNPICEFFRQNAYFEREVDRHSSEIQSLEQHIDTAVLPYLQSIFWHPKLTFQYTFHTNISSYQDTTRDYTMLGILARNFVLISSRVATNLVKIARQTDRYRNSKQKMTAAIKQLEAMYLSKQPFFGGDKPSHVDFYLLAQLKTRESSSLFMKYLQESVGGQFWHWWVRMGALCNYDAERITTI